MPLDSSTPAYQINSKSLSGLNSPILDCLNFVLRRRLTEGLERKQIPLHHALFSNLRHRESDFSLFQEGGGVTFFRLELGDAAKIGEGTKTNRKRFLPTYGEGAALPRRVNLRA
jgi:hypothetical protein